MSIIGKPFIINSGKDSSIVGWATTIGDLGNTDTCWFNENIFEHEAYSDQILCKKQGTYKIKFAVIVHSNQRTNEIIAKLMKNEIIYNQVEGNKTLQNEVTIQLDENDVFSLQIIVDNLIDFDYFYNCFVISLEEE